MSTLKRSPILCVNKQGKYIVVVLALPTYDHAFMHSHMEHIYTTACIRGHVPLLL